MKNFENFEDDLRNIDSLKGLMKIMLGNGIEKIAVGEMGLEIELTTLGLIENVPKENWKIVTQNKYSTCVGIDNDYFSAYADIRNEKAFQDLTGFEIPEYKGE